MSNNQTEQEQRKDFDIFRTKEELKFRVELLDKIESALIIMRLALVVLGLLALSQCVKIS